MTKTPNIVIKQSIVKRVKLVAVSRPNFGVSKRLNAIEENCGYMIHGHKITEIGPPRFTGRKNCVSGITISQNEHVT